MKRDNDKQKLLVELALEFERELLTEPAEPDRPDSNSSISEPVSSATDVQDLSDADLNELQGVKAAIQFLDSAKRAKRQIGEWGGADDTLPDSGRVTCDGAKPKIENASAPFGGLSENFPNVGRYEIVQSIGEGGFARVFLARDPALDRQVALKVPKPGSLVSEESRRRFLREARSTAMLGHPAIVPVFETGNDGLVSWIASEYCDGSTLSQWIKDRPENANTREQLDESAAIVQRLAEAVQHAHSRGVIHRDLKPDNILVRKGEGCASQRIQVTDFGLARHLDSNDATITVEGAILGTPAYMSPEQARGGRELTASTDIFSMGVILYELITGERPFSKSGHIATLKAIDSQQPRPPRKLNREVSPDLEAICLKALNKEPSARYRSAIDLAEDLQRMRDGKPVRARRITRVQRLHRWTKSNPLPAGAISFAAICLIVGFSVAFWHWTNSNRSNEIANTQSNRAAGHLERVAGIVDKLMDEIESLGPSHISVEQRTRLNEILELQQELISEESDDPESFKNTLRAYARVTEIHLVLGEYEQCQGVAAAAQDWLEQTGGWNQGRADIDRDILGLVVELQLDRIQSYNKTNRGNEGIGISVWLDDLLNEYSHLVTERESLYYKLKIANHRGLSLRAANQVEPSLNEHLTARTHGESLMQIGELNHDEAAAVASNLINLANRQSRTGSLKPSLGTFAEADRILEAQVAKYPDEIYWRYTLAISRSNWAGALNRHRNYDGAQTKIDLAINGLQRLVRDDPRNPSHPESLANALMRSAALAKKDKRFDEALKINQRALDLTEQGLGQTLKGSRILVEAWSYRGRLQGLKGDFSKARFCLLNAVNLGDKAFADHPDYLVGRMLLNSFRYQLLYIQYHNGDAEDFLKEVDVALSETEELIMLGPSVPKLKSMVRRQSQALQNKSIQLGKLGQWTEAIDSAKAILLLNHEESSDGVQRYHTVATVFARLSKLLETQPDRDDVLFESLQNQCVDHLELAMGINSIANLEVFERPVWDAVQATPRFQQLVKQYAASQLGRRAEQ